MKTEDSKTMIQISVANTDPGSEDFLAPESGILILDGKNPDPGSCLNIPDLIFENLLSVFWVQNTIK
jgi:hypothetical protein